MQQSTIRIFIAVAVAVLALSGFFLLKKMASLNIVRNNTVLESKAEISKWSRILPNKTKWVYYQDRPLPVNSITKGNLAQVLNGAFVAAETIPANHPITQEMVFELGKDTDYSRLLSKNKVALKIDMEYSADSSSILHPGIYIDILLTEKRMEKSNVNYVTRMIARQVLVLSILNQGKSSLGFGSSKSKTVSILVEVDKDEAKKMPVYQNSGTLSFVIDSSKDKEEKGAFDNKAYSTQDLDKKVEVIYGK